jgi:hypothetical protein
MQKRLGITLSLAAGLALGTAAFAADKLENIPLVWKPTTSMKSYDKLNLSGLENVKLQVEPFTEAREDTALIGINKENIPNRKVTTTDNVPRFVTYHFKNLLSGVGLNVVESGGNLILKGEVKKFISEETNRYNSEVELRLFLTDPSGKVLWGYSAIGTARRFGMSYKADNYYESLSDGLIAATHEFLRNPKFRDTLVVHGK